MSRYPTLFSPLQIGPVTVRNRIMQTAHVKLFTTDGHDSQRNVAYQTARARGGAGLSSPATGSSTPPRPPGCRASRTSTSRALWRSTR